MLPLKFGIEIELLGVGDYSASTIRNLEEVAIKHFNTAIPLFHDRNRGGNSHGWRYHEDGSVRSCEYHGDCDDDCDPDDCSYEEGCELVSKPLPFNQDGFDNIKLMFDVLDKTSAYVNDTCGFHVHVDASFMDGWSVAKKRRFFGHVRELYAKHEDLLDKRMNYNRRSNHNSYCDSMKNIVKESRLKYAEYVSRYYKLNTEAYVEHGTIEFRHHHGTVDYEEALSWIKTCGFFIAFAREAFEEKEATLAASLSEQEMFFHIPVR